MIKVPAYLQPGDTIAIVCPAGFMAKEKAQSCIDVLQEWGYKVKVGKTLGSDSENYFSGTDEERLQDLQQMIDDDSVQAILCGRGGYGVGRIIDRINFKSFKKKPKWIIGFSDITVLHAHIYSNYKIATLHAPMAAAFNDEGFRNEYVLSLKKAMEGKKAKYSCVPHTFNNKGEAVGELVGGNLALLANITGTPSQLKTKGRILFIEDVGEYLYSIDRMFYQLKRSGQLEKLAGLIIGGFTDMKDTERPFGKTVEEIIHELVSEYDYPVCFNFPVSHGKENYALKVGVGYKLKVGANKVTLEE
ncbi:S66 peptidase family protein [Pseudobacter ginsenosidimutans]|uniref:Muramoyltetrapeptide carboxypeptidase n=1 Tax=Pseudobacter ginsenosidimutans TaxID=661488 RepID=A0A4Q7MUK0_9BACT|nr:LD-carboxypeptidase [Pseudobacter ginsenosidimutans]QEC42376.1 LD-carboxypeptidase [Pseudobacter ginsenosidimutans]RZS70773.1 muramoyltetrapeptide carboxypeptidase [Pseudobacter ginsenosidimutans]